MLQPQSPTSSRPSISTATHSSIHSASASGSSASVAARLRRGESATSLVQGVSPLHAAASHGDPETLQILLDNDADVNARARKGNLGPGVQGATPLHFAAANGHVEAVRILMQQGARKELQDAQGVTPEQLALDGGWEEVVEILRQDQISSIAPKSFLEPSYSLSNLRELPVDTSTYPFALPPLPKMDITATPTVSPHNVQAGIDRTSIHSSLSSSSSSSSHLSRTATPAAFSSSAMHVSTSEGVASSHDSSHSSHSTRRPSLPSIFEKAKKLHPATSLKATLDRNATPPSSAFTVDHTRGNLKGQMRAGPLEDEKLKHAGPPSSASFSAMSRRLKPKRSINALMRKATDGFNSSTTTLLNSLNSSAGNSTSSLSTPAISSPSRSSLDVSTGFRRPTGRGFCSSQSNSPLSFLSQRKGSLPTSKLHREAQAMEGEGKEDAGEHIVRRRAKSTASASGGLLQVPSGVYTRESKTEEASQRHIYAVPTFAAGHPPESTSPFRGRRKDSGGSFCSSSKSSQSSTTQASLCMTAHTPAEDQGVESKDSGDRQSTFPPHPPTTLSTAAGLGQVDTLREAISSPMIPCITEVDPSTDPTASSSSVEMHRSIIFRYAHEFASEGVAPAGSGGEKITFAQQLIAVGEALAAERGRLTRTRS